MISKLTFEELRAEYGRAKAKYLADPSYENGAYLDRVASALFRRLQKGAFQ